jgi:hypothetical protein
MLPEESDDFISLQSTPTIFPTNSTKWRLLTHPQNGAALGNRILVPESSPIDGEWKEEISTSRSSELH